MAQDPQSDPVAELLRRSPLSQAQRAALWDAYESAASADELAAVIQEMPIPQQVKSALWDLKEGTPTGPREPDFRVSVTGERSLMDKAVDLLPAAGGLAGGLIGGAGGTAFGLGFGGVPGAVGGATLGGSAGEAVRQLINRARGEPAPSTAGQAARSIGLRGAGEGALTAVGAGIAKGASSLGRSFIENAVRPPIGLAKEFPDVMDTIIRERLPVGRGFLPGARAGSQQAAEKLGAAGQNVKRLIAMAEAGGKVHSSSDVLQPVLGLIDDIAKQPLGDAELRSLSNMIDEFLRRHPGPLTPTAVKELKQRAQHLAKPVYKAMAAGGSVTPEQSLGARFNTAVATGSREALETIPGVREAESTTRGLIGATKAIKQAELRRLPLAAEGISGAAAVLGGLLEPNSGIDNTLRNAAVAWLVTRGLASPRSISRAGLTLTSTQMGEFLKQFPRLAEAMVIASQPAAAGTK